MRKNRAADEFIVGKAGQASTRKSFRLVLGMLRLQQQLKSSTISDLRLMQHVQTKHANGGKTWAPSAATAVPTLTVSATPTFKPRCRPANAMQQHYTLGLRARRRAVRA